MVDRLYLWWGVSPQVVLGKAGEFIPYWGEVIGALLLLVLSVKPLAQICRVPHGLRRTMAAVNPAAQEAITGIPVAPSTCSKNI